jgi:Family of unknown function (DUF6455)
MSYARPTPDWSTDMQSIGNLMDHVQLVARMARATRTDLVAAFDAGSLSQQDWADMVQTCRHCGWAARCSDWLDENDRIDCAPETCPNRDRFEWLKDRAAVLKIKQA